jgi:hypothetical protein
MILEITSADEYETQLGLTHGALAPSAHSDTDVRIRSC